jgi:tetratricopeptide (TPR) repeat protein
MSEPTLPPDVDELIALLRSATPRPETLAEARRELVAHAASPITPSWLTHFGPLAWVLVSVALLLHDGPLAPRPTETAPALAVVASTPVTEPTIEAPTIEPELTAPPPPAPAIAPIEAPATPAPLVSRRARPQRAPRALDVAGKQDAPTIEAIEAPVSSAPSAELADALRQYASARYAEAAVALQRVIEGGTEDGPARVAQADFFLAKCLYHLGLHHASAAAFDAITQRGPSHPYFGASLEWLAMLAQQLPEPSGVIESVGRYDAAALAALDNDATRSHYHHLQLLLGRARYRDGRLDEAVALLRSVPDGSRYALEARFHEGIAHVRQRRARPAMAAFRSVIESVERGRTGGHPDPQRLYELAWMSIARLYYALAMQPRLDDDRASELMTLAVAAWRHIPLSSEHWLDSFEEETWALYVTREHGRALGHVHALDSPYFRDRADPEAQVIRAMIFFEHCQWSAVEQSIARFHERFDGVYEDARQAARMAATNEDAFRMLAAVRAGRSRVPARALPSLRAAFADRELLRHLEQVGSITREQGRLAAMVAPIFGSSLATRLEGELAVVRSMAVDRAGELARERILRVADELGERMSQIDTIEVELATSQRVELTSPNPLPMGPPDGGRILAVQGDQAWPWDGEWWRDELPFYVQEIESRCGR